LFLVEGEDDSVGSVDGMMARTIVVEEGAHSR
jgi:hypothetical protein